MSRETNWAIGFDVGGTYVDVVACSSAGEIRADKHPYGGQLVAQAALNAIRATLRLHAIEPGRVIRVVHGSTVVTNLLLERDAAPIAVITTSGFADVLTLGRQSRAALYEAVPRPPVPTGAFPRRLRFELTARIDAAGNEVAPLDEAEVHAIADRLGTEGVASAAVCLLFAHVEADHELRVGRILAERLPRLEISLSHRVDGGPREFERSLTTALDAYVKPTARGYLATVSRELGGLGLPALGVMRSDGSVGEHAAVVERPIALAASGPAATLIAVAGAARSAAGSDATPPTVLSMDIGGTTTDLGLVTADGPQSAQALQIDAQQIRMRCADITSIAVGGGSVAALHAAGALRLGPRSQGARPGPACYGLGGDEPTLTDALVVLARLPGRLAGGIALDAGRAAQAMSGLARRLGRSPREIAQAIVATANAAIAEGLRTHAFLRGVDPAQCVLFAVGGGGGQHAAEVARIAGIRDVRILPESGVIGALGLLLGPQGDAVETPVEAPLEPALLARLVQAGEEAVPGAWRDADARWTLAVDYQGQDAPIDVPFEPGRDDAGTLQARFDALHERLRGRSMRAAAYVRRLRLELRRESPPPRPEAAGARGEQPWGDCPGAGRGPKMLVAATTSAWVPADWHWRIDAGGVLALAPEPIDE